MVNEIKKQTALITGLLKKNARGFDWAELQRTHRVRIGYFQHERLIHLLITLFFGLLAFMDVLAILFTNNQILIILAPILLVMSALYVWHYFCLENGVQKLYRLDGEIENKK